MTIQSKVTNKNYKLQIKNVSRFFGQFQAVKNISFDVNQGEILGFLGPNGAGKTTTIRLITGVLFPSNGSILINNIDIEKEPLKAKSCIGYLPEQAPIWPEMTVIDYLNFCARMKNMTTKEIKLQVKKYIDLCSLNEVAFVAVDTLSKGYKRRVCLAQALLNDPPILILDEPTDGLDPNQKKEMRDLIYQLGKEKIIIISTHILEEVDAVCNRVAIIANGELVFIGTPKEMRKKSIYAGTLSISFEDKTIKEENIISQLKTLPHINHVYHKSTFYRLYLDKETSIETVISQLLSLKLPKIECLNTDQGHLDDVFYCLTTQGK